MFRQIYLLLSDRHKYTQRTARGLPRAVLLSAAVHSLSFTPECRLARAAFVLCFLVKERIEVRRVSEFVFL